MNKREKSIITKTLSGTFKEYCNERRKFKKHLENDNPRFPLEPVSLVEARSRFLAVRDLAIQMGITSAAYLLDIESMITAE